jgi:hypothetical protein
MKLTINVITRNRSYILIPILDTILKNIRNKDTTLMVSVDDDDDRTQLALGISGLKDHVHLSVKPREDSRGEKYDRALKECPADVYLAAVDCVPIHKEGFDNDILEAASLFPDGIGCVYTAMCNASFPGFQAPTARLVEKLGCIYSHDYPFWFIDHELDDISRIINRISYVDIKSDHHVHRPAKTIGLRDLHFWAAYYDAGQIERRRKAHAIINGDDFLDPPWRKELSLRHHGMIEYRSMWVNQLVRDQARDIEASRGGAESEEDERYRRIKAKAEKQIMAWFEEIEQLAA